MKKIVILFSVIMAAAGLVFAAEKGEKAASKSTTAAAATEHKIFTANDIQWGEAPPSLPAGAKMAVLDGDPTKSGSFTIRLKMPAGYKIPAHTHPTTERVTGISGNGRLGMGERLDESAAKDVAPGTFVILPANMAHFAYANEECVVQIQSEGPFQIKYVNPSDDPRNATKK